MLVSIKPKSQNIFESLQNSYFYTMVKRVLHMVSRKQIFLTNKDHPNVYVRVIQVDGPAYHEPYLVLWYEKVALKKVTL